jgi:hypothetical protein
MSTQYDYVLLPRKTGRLTIGPVTLVDGGKTYRTEPIVVEVREGGATAPARAGGREPASGAPGRPGPAPAEKMFIELTADKSEAYLHEQVTLTFRFYNAGLSLAEQPSYEAPATPGFVEKHLGSGRSTNYIQVLNGRRYQVSELQTALYPYQTGELTVGPARLRGSVLVEAARRQPGARGFFDIDDIFEDPFFGRFSSKPFEILSNQVKIRVKPLPKEGAPPGEVSVGRYSLRVEAKPTEVHVGDPITLTMSVSGEGDLERVSPPVLSSLEGFKRYDVTSSTDVTGRTGGITGVKTFEQAVVPLSEKIREIPQIVFNYFDPAAGKYVTLRERPIPLMVLPAKEGDAARIVSLPSGTEKAGVKLLERNIVFIKTAPGSLVKGKKALDLSLVFWLVQCIPPVLVLTALFHARHAARMRSDAGYARLRGAGRMTRRRLASVEAALREGKAGEFYSCLARVMTMYVADRLTIPPGGLTTEIINEKIMAAGVPAELAERLDRLLRECDLSRFTVATVGRAEMEKSYREAVGILGCLRKCRIKKG